MKLCLALLAFVLLGPSLLSQQPTPVPAKPAENPPASEKAATPPETTPAVALLHVYRHHRYEGSALAPSIYIDELQVARVGSGRRFTAKLSPGSHTIRSDDKSSAISIDAKPGQEYYIRIDEKTGFWKGHGQLTMLMPEQGKAEYQLQKPIEPDRRIAKEVLVDEQ